MVTYTENGSQNSSPETVNAAILSPGSVIVLCPPPARKGSSLNDQILNALDEEIARLRQARALLTGRSQAKPARSQPATSPTHQRRKFSAKARRAIADAQRKRWAKVKSQKKPAGPAVEAKTEPAAPAKGTSDLDANFPGRRCICPLGLFANPALRYPPRRVQEEKDARYKTAHASHDAWPSSILWIVTNRVFMNSRLVLEAA